MQKSCAQCSQQFNITDDDRKFYESISPIFNGVKYPISEPTHCPNCRQQRRMAFRNERSLYHRKCDMTGKQIISMYSPDKPFPVYNQEEWWGDKWSPFQYGQDFDFNRPFFEQFAALLQKVPRISLINKEPENSEYCNFALRNKDSYLLFTCAENQNCYYSNRTWTSRDCCDCSNVLNCELCYEVIDSNNCYNCVYLQNSANCSDCTLGYDLTGCKNCFACYGLHNAQYCVGNKQLTKEKYQSVVESFTLNFEKAAVNFEKHKKDSIRKYMNAINCENCTGDAITNGKNAIQCYEVKNVEDCKYVSNVTNMKNSYDVDNDDNSEFIYEAVGSESNNMNAFNDICWFTNSIFYCTNCFHSSNLFGCNGMKHAQYCILNKQYSKEEYEAIVPKIIEHMQRPAPDGAGGTEWGEFFPAAISPFAYNESFAMDYYPLSKEQVHAKGLRWHEEDKKGENYMGPKTEIPKTIEEVDDSICSQILTCEETGKPFKIMPAELQFYRNMKLPIPRKCPDVRHRVRIGMRNPRHLWKRNCMKCNVLLETTYAAERPEKIYCEKCYFQEIM